MLSARWEWTLVGIGQNRDFMIVKTQEGEDGDLEFERGELAVDNEQIESWMVLLNRLDQLRPFFRCRCARLLPLGCSVFVYTMLLCDEMEVLDDFRLFDLAALHDVLALTYLFLQAHSAVFMAPKKRMKMIIRL